MPHENGSDEAGSRRRLTGAAARRERFNAQLAEANALTDAQGRSVYGRLGPAWVEEEDTPGPERFLGGQEIRQIGDPTSGPFGTNSAYTVQGKPASSFVQYDPEVGYYIPRWVEDDLAGRTSSADFFSRGGGVGLLGAAFGALGPLSTFGAAASSAGGAEVLSAGAELVGGATPAGATSLADIAASAGLGEPIGANAYFPATETPFQVPPDWNPFDEAYDFTTPPPEGVTPLPPGTQPPAPVETRSLPPGTPPPPAPGPATAIGAGTALSRIINGGATTADWLSVLGTGGATALGMFSSNQQAKTLADLAEKTRLERAPFLGKANEWLLNPEAYGAGPGRAAMESTLAGLSAQYGNPIGSGTALSIATDAGLRDWRNAVTGMANLGLGGQDLRAHLETGAAGKTGDIWSNLAGGVSRLINAPKSLADLLREYNLNLTVGGARI